MSQGFTDNVRSYSQLVSNGISWLIVRLRIAVEAVSDDERLLDDY